ncbi:MAG TPA: hypothetical protein VF283_09525 [Bryobacteraceae bacterium]
MEPYKIRAISGNITFDPQQDPSSPSNFAEPLLRRRLIKLHLRRAVLSVIIACTVLIVAAVVAFPEQDDGYWAMLLKELGPPGTLTGYLGSPAIGWLWYVLVQSCGIYFWPVAILLSAALWVIFALESSYFWIVQFPEHSECAPLAGCLTIAPIVVAVQTTTLALASVALLPAALAYASLFMLMRASRSEASNYPFIFGLVTLAAGAILGESALPVGIIIFILFIRGYLPQSDGVLRQQAKRIAYTALATTAVAYIVYRVTTYSSSAAASHVSRGIWRTAAGLPFNILSAAWHTVIGAYGTAVGSFYLSWGSKTLLVSLVVGLLFAWIIASAVISENGEPFTAWHRLQTAVLALFAALIPIEIMHPNGASSQFPRYMEYASRFFIPILPVAACLTIALFLSFVQPRRRAIIVAALGVLIGFTLLNQIWTGFHRQTTLAGIGSSLKPYVAASSGTVVGVLSTNGLCFADYACTAKATSNWPAETSKHFWMYTEREALRHLGPRKPCRPPSQANPGMRAVRRSEPITNVLWIQMTNDHFSLSPYCVSSALPAASHYPLLKSTSAKGILSGTFSTAAGVVDLTQLDASDWEAWTSAASANHKADGGKQIYYYNTIGRAVVRDYSGSPVGISWSDGTPIEQVSELHSGIAISGRGRGFQIAAPADGITRTLSVYVGARETRGQLTAHLSDGSAPDYTDSSLSDNGSGTAGVYKLIYRARAAGQTIVITYTQLTPASNGKIILQAAALVAGDSR